MSTRRLNQTGATGQPLVFGNHATRSSTRVAANTSAEGKSQSSNTKKSKPVTVGEMARQTLTDKNCILAEEQITSETLFKIFYKILKKFSPNLSEDLHTMLQAYLTLLQENANSEHISKKAIDIVVKRLEDRLKISMEASLDKVSLAVKSLIANQRTLQEMTVVIADVSETLQKVAHNIDNSVKETTATSNQLSTTITSYKEALLSVNNTNTQAASPAPNNSRYEDPRLAKHNG